MKKGEIDLTSVDAEDKKIIYEDKKMMLREEIKQLKIDKASILDSMVVDQGIEADHDKCNRMRAIDTEIKEKEAELNEKIK